MAPEDFKIVVSDAPAYKQFGNSVVVPVVTSVAEQVVKTLKKYEMVNPTKREVTDGEVTQR